MAMDEAPPFWWQDFAWQAWMLAPAAFVYGKVSGGRMLQAPAAEVPVPVICVGNFVVGGAGKTPTVEMISLFARKKGFSPGVLTRGHGGAITTATVVKRDHHNSHDVGDEALLHAAHAVTVVSADRPTGAELLVEQGCDLIIMDDGFQNPSLAKDFRLVVLDAKRGLGNGFTIPAGPVRVPLRLQLMEADSILLLGTETNADKVLRKAARAGKPIFHARAKPVMGGKFSGKKVIGYAGIADPSKFFATLAETGAEIVAKFPFGDHHVFTEIECQDLLREAQSQDAMLVTTAKDAARLKDRGEAMSQLLEVSTVLHMALEPDNPGMVERILETAVRNFDRRKFAMTRPVVSE